MAGYTELANGVGDVILEWARDKRPVGPTQVCTHVCYSTCKNFNVASVGVPVAVEGSHNCSEVVH